MKNYFIYTGQLLSIDGKLISPQTTVKIVQQSESGLTALVETVYTNQGTRFHVASTDLTAMFAKEIASEELDYSKITNVLVDGIDTADQPDFCDAYITSAYYKGEPMTETQIEILNKDSEFINTSVFKQLY